VSFSVRPATSFADVSAILGPPGRHDDGLVGTRALFEAVGLTLACPTDAVSGGFPRVVMRLLL
jgi:hypothetical protein